MNSLLAEWKKVLRRAGAMSTREMAERLRQQAMARADWLRYRVGLPFEPRLVERMPSAQKPVFFFSAEDIPSLCVRLRERFPQGTKAILEQSERICDHKFDLLGYDDLDYGQEIDWHCDRVHGKVAPRKPFYRIRFLDFTEVGDSKVTWELNRHQHMVTLAKAFRLTGDPKIAGELFRQWNHWHRENPYPIGVNWASSLEVAFRSISWLWMCFMLSGSVALSEPFRSEIYRYLGISARHIEAHLSTYFSPNTHLLGEGVALFFIGTLCPELRDSSRWQRRGWGIVQHEAERQIRADGLHFEQSTYYHVYALDLFLHSLILASLNGIPVPVPLERRIKNMCEALCILGRSGPIPRLGDDDGGRLFNPRRNLAEHMLDPLSTGAVLFGRGDFKSVAGLREETLWLLGDPGLVEFDRLAAVPQSSASHAFRDSGLYVMSDDRQQLVIDAGPQGADSAGHGHADALSVVLSRDGNALLIDPGTFEYVGQNGGRNRFRGTKAHNTLVVDGLDQSEPKGPFSWATLPKVNAEGWICGENFDLFVGSHGGYRRLPNPIVHRRLVFFLKKHFWVVRDQVIGAGKHDLEILWHLDSKILPTEKNDGIFKNAEDEFAIITPENHGWSRELVRDEWSPAYGRKEPSSALCFRTLAMLPTELVTLLLPSEGSVERRRYLLVRATEASDTSVAAYVLRAEGEEHLFVFARPQPWSFLSWSSDAEFFYCGETGNGSRRTLICCNGSYAEKGQKRIISSEGPFLRCEVTSSGSSAKVVSSVNNVVVEMEAFRLAVLRSDTNEACSTLTQG